MNKLFKISLNRNGFHIFYLWDIFNQPKDLTLMDKLTVDRMLEFYIKYYESNYILKVVYE